MDFQLLFFLSLLGYLILALYLSIIALSEDNIKRYKVLIAFTAILLSIFALGFYFEIVEPALMPDYLL